MAGPHRDGHRLALSRLNLRPTAPTRYGQELWWYNKKRFAFTEGQWWLIDQVVDYLEPPELYQGEWPRVSNLPPQEQEPFSFWLAKLGATRPVLEGVDDDEQDGYYDAFYQQWKDELAAKD